MLSTVIFKIVIVVVFAFIVASALVGILFSVWVVKQYIKNTKQEQHSVLRRHWLLGLLRYFFEAIGAEIRQYWTDTDNEGMPFSRVIYRHIVKLGKYLSNIIPFGSLRDFSQPGFFILNSLYAILEGELKVDNSKSFDTYAYRVKRKTLFSRKDERYEVNVKPYLLDDQHAIVIGKDDKLVESPWINKSLINMSAMSFGSLGDHSIETLAHGLNISFSHFNTGEGGISKHHLVGGGTGVYQFGPAMFGCRFHDGTFNPEMYLQRMNNPQIIATEVKFHQGAKTKGGFLPKEKITPYISEIRGIPMGVDCVSPNSYPHIRSNEQLGMFLTQLKELSRKPVGIKIAMGQWFVIDDAIAYMTRNNCLPNYIALDGSEGGSGATPQDMADSLSLPIFQSIVLLDAILHKHGVKDRVKIFASGKLVTADQIAIALALGADCVNTARGLMIQLGCILALDCDSNECPVGVATQDPKLQGNLVIAEKKYRVANYIATLRKSLFSISAACGLESPTLLLPEHIAYKNGNGIIVPGKDWYNTQAYGLI